MPIGVDFKVGYMGFSGPVLDMARSALSYFNKVMTQASAT